MRFPRATQSNAEWSRLDRTLFCVLAGVVSTFASGYTYGEVNQVEHLPQIFRALDAEYLTGDFFLNAVDTFNPRFYYVWLMAALGAWIPLPVLFVALTCLANAAVAAVTYYIARRMSRDDDLTAALACCMVLAVNGFNAGSATHIPQDFLEPALLARPLAMLGLWWTIKGEAARPAGLFVAAIALHPLVGPETAAVAVAAAGVALLVEMRRPRDLRPLLTGARARRLLIVTMVCVVTTAVFWGRGYVRTLGHRAVYSDPRVHAHAASLHPLAIRRGPPSRFRGVLPRGGALVDEVAGARARPECGPRGPRGGRRRAAGLRRWLCVRRAVADPGVDHGADVSPDLPHQVVCVPVVCAGGEPGPPIGSARGGAIVGFLAGAGGGSLPARDRVDGDHRCRSRPSARGGAWRYRDGTCRGLGTHHSRSGGHRHDQLSW